MSDLNSDNTAGPERAKQRPAPNPLRHETRLLPNAALNPRAALGAACRTRFDGRSLREAAEYVYDCDTGKGTKADDFADLIITQTGTVGAKQAFLAALAAEIDRTDIELIVACCEMPLPAMPGSRAGTTLQRPHTLPLAVCWLRYRGRRIQIVEPSEGSQHTAMPVTEVVVRPEQFAAERIRLYEAFAADWCRALEANPLEFARLRAWQLRAAVDTSLFEDLLGYSLAADYQPAL